MRGRQLPHHYISNAYDKISMAFGLILAFHVDPVLSR